MEPNKRYFFSCGLVGVTVNGDVLPGIEAQTRAIYNNIQTLLKEAGMSMSDLVKVTTYLVDAAEQPQYAVARKPFFEGLKPAMTLVQVASLLHPDYRVEVEFIAAR